MPNLTEAFPHQRETSRFILEREGSLVLSDPGTGKTRCVLDAFVEHRQANPDARLVVTCPKGIMQAAWGGDIQKFQPHLNVAYSTSGKKRRDAFASSAEVVVMNHEGVNNAKDWINEFSPENMWYVGDEFTWFKNPTAKRSRSCLKFVENIPKKTLMSGTPFSSTVCDIFMPMKILDGGATLGANYYRFRNMMQYPVMKGQFREWKDKQDAMDKITLLLHDIAIRYAIEEVCELPEMGVIDYKFDLNPKLRGYFNQLKEEAELTLSQGQLTPVNAGVLANKIRQVLAGVVYGDDREVLVLDDQRTKLVLDIAQEHDSAVIAFQWNHQKEQLMMEAYKRNMKYGVIDAQASVEERTEIVNLFQTKQIDYIFSHPRCLAHGYTLTRSATTIWASPESSYELYHQFNARVYRNTQTRNTQVIRILSNDTGERRAFDRVDGMTVTNEEFLRIIAEQTATS